MVGDILRKRGKIVARADFKISLKREQAIAKVIELAKIHHLPGFSRNTIILFFH